MRALIQKAEAGLVRKRFNTREELFAGLYAALVEYLAAKELNRFGPLDAAACAGATVDNLEVELMTRFVRTARRVRGFPLPEDAPPETVLEYLNLRYDGQLTNAAVLLFGKSPQRFLISSGVTCAHFHGRHVVKPIPAHQKFQGNVFALVDQAVDFVLSKIPLDVGARADSVRAPVTYEIPKEVVTEAIVNAVAHRDYTSNGSVQVMLFADRLDILNPGRLPPSLTIEQLKQPHASLPGNPLIAAPLYLNQYIEQSGTGTLDMTRRCLDAGLSEPEFSVSGGFMATVRGAALAGRNGIRSVVIARCQNVPVAEVELLVLFPDRTWKRAITDEEGMAHLELHATHFPMTVFAAREGFRACVSTGWIPDDGSLALELTSLLGGGSVIFHKAVGSVPGLAGWINPIRDPRDRLYLYTFEISVNGGRPQPVEFNLGEDLRLADATGTERSVCIAEIQGRAALVEYRG